VIGVQRADRDRFAVRGYIFRRCAGGELWFPKERASRTRMLRDPAMRGACYLNRTIKSSRNDVPIPAGDHLGFGLFRVSGDESIRPGNAFPYYQIWSECVASRLLWLSVAFAWVRRGLTMLTSSAALIMVALGVNMAGSSKKCSTVVRGAVHLSPPQQHQRTHDCSLSRSLTASFIIPLKTTSSASAISCETDLEMPSSTCSAEPNPQRP